MVPEFGMAHPKQEGHTMNYETGESWKTSEEEKYLLQLRTEVRRDRRAIAILGTISIVWAGMAVCLVIMEHYL